MKKSLILLCALASVGLLASCQKDSVPSGEVQPAEELNVISIDTWSDKADLEPLLVFAEEIVGIDQEGEKKETSLIIKVLREFFQSVGNIIGRHDETPVHSLQYFGNGRSFGLAVDQIRELSFNLGQSDVPYLRIQLGNANELKIGSLEVMPVSNFLLDVQGSDRIRGKAELGEMYKNGYGRILVSDALFVKFSYKGSSYAFAIYAEESDARHTKTYAGEDSAFGFVFGTYFNEYPTLMDWYNNCLPIGEDAIVPMQPRVSAFPVSRTVAMNYLKSGNSVYCFVKLRDRAFLATSGIDGVSVELRVGDPDLLGSDWMEAYLHSSDEGEVRDLVHDYLRASVFGCTQSECRALSAEFAQAFDEAIPECNLARLNNWYEFDGQKKIFEAEVPLAIVPRAASGMVWKPALGLKLTLGDGSTRLISFAEFDALDGDGKQALWEALYPDYTLPGIFSVAENKKVKFSRGNLQYKASSGTWRCAEHQYDVIGDTPGNNTKDGRSGQTAWIDLFGWGATGRNPYGQMPYSTEPDDALYKTELNSSESEVLTRENGADWGVCIGPNWRTLSSDEWGYLLKSAERMVYSKPCITKFIDGSVTIEEKAHFGVFIYPDNYNGDEITASMNLTWQQIAEAGIVFLPTNGGRWTDPFDPSTFFIENVNDSCNYWSSTGFDSESAEYLFLNAMGARGMIAIDGRSAGLGVRLVTDIENAAEER